MSAEVQESGNKKGKSSKQKKMNVRVDFTPMVDMNMLLITFFMLCTSLSKPQTMEISMPSNDDVPEDQQTKVKESLAVTLLLDKDNKAYYYEGKPDYKNYASLKETTYTADGLRDILLNKNKSVVRKMLDLKKQKSDLKIDQKEFDEKAKEIKGDKNSPTVIIKATDEATYKNLVDALDEMQICSISKYVIVPITDGDKALLENYKTKGAHLAGANKQ